MRLPHKQLGAFSGGEGNKNSHPEKTRAFARVPAELGIGNTHYTHVLALPIPIKSGRSARKMLIDQ